MTSEEAAAFDAEMARLCAKEAAAQPTSWIPGLVDLLERRPELRTVGYASHAREVSS